MKYDQIHKKVALRLDWLNSNARHAIILRETFTVPAYDSAIRKIIAGTNRVRCYKVYLDAVYFEFIMTLMRMYDGYKSDDTACFEKLFECLSNDVIQNIESESRRRVKSKIKLAVKEYSSLKNSDLVASLKTVRNKMYAHTSTNFNQNLVAKYGFPRTIAEKNIAYVE